jgi:hypothetical protein
VVRGIENDDVGHPIFVGFGDRRSALIPEAAVTRTAFLPIRRVKARIKSATDGSSMSVERPIVTGR